VITVTAPLTKRCLPHLLRALFAVALTAGAPAGMAQSSLNAPVLPTLGDTEREDLSPIMERKLGEEIMRDIRRDRDYLDDDIILEYLNNFGTALVAARPGARGESGYDFFFFAVRDPMLNAFALPGGFIAVHSALLLAAQSESELASVLSHEIGHVAQRHIARQLGQQRQDSLIPLAAMVLAVLAARASPDASMALITGGQGLALQRQLNFSRDAEREADRVGFQIMGAAGFDTSGMVAFFGRLQTASRAYSDLTPAYLRTHPLTSERIADIQARIRETPYKQRVDSIDFYLMRARARVLQDESSSGLADTRLTFEGQLNAAQGRQQQVAAQYGLAYLALRKGELAAAQKWLDAARASAVRKQEPATFSAARPDESNGEAIFASMSIEIKLAPGQPPGVLAAAVKEAEMAHAKFPLSRGIARQYSDALIANGRLEEAAHYLRDQVALYRQEPKLQEQLAKAYSAQGKIALQHLALAESYALTGGVMTALDQLNLARKAPDASFYDMAIIDARERELQARRREELKDNKQKDKDKE
jgi:predicted Zn-dependent protease